MLIPKDAAECWYHSCAAHYCLVESWTQPCTYPDCQVKDFETGEPYYKKHKKRIEQIERIMEKQLDLFGDEVIETNVNRKSRQEVIEDYENFFHNR